MSFRQAKLTPRLAVICDMVVGVVCADIGTDHALLPCALVQSGRVSHAYATDINPGPLARAQETIAACGLSGKVETLLCDGIPPAVAAACGTVIVAGLGGETIAEILARASIRPHTQLLLQPMTRAPQLRAWLCGSGYTILRERLAAEPDRIYTVLEACPAPGEHRPAVTDAASPLADVSRGGAACKGMAREGAAREGAAREGADCKGAAREGAAYSAAEIEIGRFGGDADPVLVRAHVRARLASLYRKRAGLARGGAPAQERAALESLIRACEEEYHDFI